MKRITIGIRSISRTITTSNPISTSYSLKRSRVTSRTARYSTSASAVAVNETGSDTGRSPSRTRRKPILNGRMTDPRTSSDVRIQVANDGRISRFQIGPRKAETDADAQR